MRNSIEAQTYITLFQNVLRFKAIIMKYTHFISLSGLNQHGKNDLTNPTALSLRWEEKMNLRGTASLLLAWASSDFVQNPHCNNHLLNMPFLDCSKTGFDDPEQRIFGIINVTFERGNKRLSYHARTASLEFILEWHGWSPSSKFK